MDVPWCMQEEFLISTTSRQDVWLSRFSQSWSWEVTPYSAAAIYRRFGRIHCLHVQSREALQPNRTDSLFGVRVTLSSTLLRWRYCCSL
jgi:hypothetical protein